MTRARSGGFFTPETENDSPFKNLAEADQTQLMRFLKLIENFRKEDSTKDFSDITFSDSMIEKLSGEAKKLILDKISYRNLVGFKPSQSIFNLLHTCGNKNYSHMNLSGLRLNEKKFNQCRFDNANLSLCAIANADFYDCSFKKADMSKSDACDTTFLRCDLSETSRFDKMKVNTRTTFDACDMPSQTEKSMSIEVIKNGDFKPSQSLFDFLYVGGFTQFTKMDLSTLNLNYKRLENCDFTGSNLSYCQMLHTKLNRSKLNDVNLTYANACGASFENAEIKNTTVDHICINIDTDFSKADAMQNGKRTFEDHTPILFYKPNLITKDPRPIQTTIKKLYTSYEKKCHESSSIIQRFLNGIRSLFKRKSADISNAYKLFKAMDDASHDFPSSGFSKKQRAFD